MHKNLNQLRFVSAFIFIELSLVDNFNFRSNLFFYFLLVQCCHSKQAWTKHNFTFEFHAKNRIMWSLQYCICILYCRMNSFLLCFFFCFFIFVLPYRDFDYYFAFSRSIAIVLSYLKPWTWFQLLASKYEHETCIQNNKTPTTWTFSYFLFFFLAFVSFFGNSCFHLFSHYY